MKVLIIGHNGWIGKMMCELLNNKKIEYVTTDIRPEMKYDFENEIIKHKPSHIMSFIGRTHGTIGDKEYATIDYLEQKGKIKENVRDNLFAPVVTALLCKKYSIHFTYIGTGCIFSYDDNHRYGDPTTGFSDDDIPNFNGSSYSIVKGYTDELMHMFNDTVLNLRIRMPITSKLEPRNFITKILKYEYICSVPNSMSVLDELLPYAIDMAEKKITGTYNFTNPGLVTHNEILEMYKEFVDDKLVWKNFSIDEQTKILDAGRSNNCLDTNKILSLYPEIKNIKESVRDTILKIAKVNKKYIVVKNIVKKYIDDNNKIPKIMKIDNGSLTEYLINVNNSIKITSFQKFSTTTIQNNEVLILGDVIKNIYGHKGGLYDIIIINSDGDYSIINKLLACKIQANVGTLVVLIGNNIEQTEAWNDCIESQNIVEIDKISDANCTILKGKFLRNKAMPSKYEPYWSNYLEKFNKSDEHFQNIPRNTNKFCVMVEPRKHNALIPVMKNFMYMLQKKNYGLIVFHGPRNEKFVKYQLKNWKNVIFVDLGVDNLTIEKYNNIYTSQEFWQICLTYGCEHALTFQCDTLLFKDNVDDFIEYDYIGAPFSTRLGLVHGFSKHFNMNSLLRIGNGGLSIRNVHKMIEIIQKYASTRGYLNEDIFFGIVFVKYNYHIPDVETASKFSVESMFYNDPCGIHKPDIELITKEGYAKLFDNK